MYNDSIEILLLRHYGHNGPTPNALEQRLINSVRQDAMAQQQQEQARIRILKHRMSRRRAVKLVAVGSSGLGLLAAGLEMLDATIFGCDAPYTSFT
jgi:hypothetical protein